MAHTTVEFLLPFALRTGHVLRMVLLEREFGSTESLLNFKRLLTSVITESLLTKRREQGEATLFIIFQHIGQQFAVRSITGLPKLAKAKARHAIGNYIKQKNARNRIITSATRTHQLRCCCYYDDGLTLNLEMTIGQFSEFDSGRMNLLVCLRPSITTPPVHLGCNRRLPKSGRITKLGNTLYLLLFLEVVLQHQQIETFVRQ